jgi:hypothetical protein
LDSADIGLGVSRLELEQHLHTVLPVRQAASICCGCNRGSSRHAAAE